MREYILTYKILGIRFTETVPVQKLLEFGAKNAWDAAKNYLEYNNPTARLESIGSRII